MPKSVMFVIFLLIAALGVSLTLVTGEASPVRTDQGAEVGEELVPDDGAEPEVPVDGEAEPDADPVESEVEEETIVEEPEVDPMAANLDVLTDADAASSDRLAAAKALLGKLEGSPGQGSLMEQVSTLETAMAADPSAELPSEFVDAVAALTKGAQGD